jgi:hypothetical protein
MSATVLLLHYVCRCARPCGRTLRAAALDRALPRVHHHEMPRPTAEASATRCRMPLVLSQARLPHRPGENPLKADSQVWPRPCARPDGGHQRRMTRNRDRDMTSRLAELGGWCRLPGQRSGIAVMLRHDRHGKRMAWLAPLRSASTDSTT